MSYCCIIPGAEDISTVLNGFAVSRPCVRCLSAATDIPHLWCCESRNLEQTKWVREHTRKEAKRHSERGGRCDYKRIMECGKKILRSFLLSSWKSLLEQCNPVLHNKRTYSLFTFQQLHNLHLAIPKLAK